VMPRLIALVLLCGMALSSPTSASAGDASATLDVSLKILPGCTVSAAPLAFVAHAGATSEAEAPIEVLCAADTGVALSLDSGQNAAGAQRQLVSETGAAVPYTIYTDPARTQSWRGGPIRAATGQDGALRLVVYGRIEGRDSAVTTGDYRDSVTVTIAF
jgi:spore coat protein U-like protein